MSLAKLVPVTRLKYLTKIRDVTIDDFTFRLHYRFTFTFLFIGSLLLSGEQFFGKPIQCINVKDGTVPDKVVENFCWIEGTFTLPTALMKVIGYDVAAPGIEQYNEFVNEVKNEKDEIIEHSYYQWVGLVLFLQALTFYISHVMWKTWEKSKMSNIINELNKSVLEAKKRTKGKKNLVEYLRKSMGKNNSYAFRYFLCEIINLINVVLQMIFTNWLLNGEFSDYGLDVLKFLNNVDPSQRIDPMAKIFPKMTKCTFRRYGPSGDIVKTDHLCMLPLNILNEKMFIVFWFWLYIVLVFSIIKVIKRFMLVMLKGARFYYLTWGNTFTDKGDLRTLLRYCTYGDWFLIHLLSVNLDPLHFRDVMHELADQLENGEPIPNDYSKQVDEDKV